MTFDLDLWPFDHMNIVRFQYYINKPNLFQIGLQLFKWGHFHIFNQSYNLTSDDLWPWYATFDLIIKWGFPCCIYDSTLVEINQSMWKIRATCEPVFTTDNNNRQHQQTRQQPTKWSLCVLHAKADDTMSDHIVSLWTTKVKQDKQKLVALSEKYIKKISWILIQKVLDRFSKTGRKRKRKRMSNTRVTSFVLIT